LTVIGSNAERESRDSFNLHARRSEWPRPYPIERAEFPGQNQIPAPQSTISAVSGIGSPTSAVDLSEETIVRGRTTRPTIGWRAAMYTADPRCRTTRAWPAGCKFWPASKTRR